MRFTVTSLASGSSGNALLVQAGDDAILIDCGIALRTLERHLRYRAVAPSQIRAVLLTHEHGDHAHSAAALARRHKIPVVCNAETYAAMETELAEAEVEVLPIGQRANVGPFDVTSFLLPHDAAAPVGYRVAALDATLGVAIDLGSWTEAIAEHLCGLDLLVVEANHDREQLMAAPYPWPIRQRIFGPLGHLDNVDTGALLAHVCGKSGACDVWLAHLSEHANSPKRAVAGVKRVLTMAGITAPRITALPRKSAPAPNGAPVWTSDFLFRQGKLF